MSSEGTQRARRPRKRGTRLVSYDCWKPLGIDSTNKEDQEAVIRLIKEAYAPILNAYLAEGEGKDATNLFKSQSRQDQFKDGCRDRIKQLPKYVRTHVPKTEELLDFLYDALRHFRYTDDAWLYHMDVPIPGLRRSSRFSLAEKPDTGTEQKNTPTKAAKRSLVVTLQAPSPQPEQVTRSSPRLKSKHEPRQLSRPRLVPQHQTVPRPQTVPRLQTVPRPQVVSQPQLQPQSRPKAPVYPYIQSDPKACAESPEQESPRPPRPPRPIKGTSEWDTEYQKRLIPLRFYNRGSDYDLLDQDWVMDSDPYDKNYGLRDPALSPVLGQPEIPRYVRHPWEKYP